MNQPSQKENGSLDSSWGEDGVVFFDADIDAIALQPDGKLLAAGSYKDSEDTIFPIFARFNPNGTLDTFFDEDGTNTLAFLFNSNLDDYNPIKGLTLQADGKFLVAAELDNGSIALARFNSDGYEDL